MTDFHQILREFERNRSESLWLDMFECLRASLSRTLGKEVQLGRYWISDFPGHASAGGAFNFRCRAGIPDMESDGLEGVLSWSCNRGERGDAGAWVVPFLRNSAVQPLGRLSDLGPGCEVEQVFSYSFHDGRFEQGGWEHGHPGEWAYITEPGDFYDCHLSPSFKKNDFAEGEEIVMKLRLDDLSSIKANQNLGSTPRISLIHVNRDRERSNLVPWTSRPPKENSGHVQTISDCENREPGVLLCRLDRFNIRGAWKPGKYHLSVRVQNFHEAGNWSWSSQISKPIKLRIHP